jgi:hypothetical protein
MKRQPVQSEEMPVFIGIDYHKAYSVYNVLDMQGESLGQGRIDHAHPEDFNALVRRWPGCRVVFEALYLHPLSRETGADLLRRVLSLPAPVAAG